MKFKIAKNPHLGDPHPSVPAWGIICGCWGAKRNGDFDAFIAVGGFGPEPRKLGISGKLICVGTGPKEIDRDERGGAMWAFKDKYGNYGADGPDLRTDYPALAAFVSGPDGKGCRGPRVYETGSGNDALDRELEKIVASAPRSKWGRGGE